MLNQTSDIPCDHCSLEKKCPGDCVHFIDYTNAEKAEQRKQLLDNFIARGGNDNDLLYRLQKRFA